MQGQSKVVRIDRGNVLKVDKIFCTTENCERLYKPAQTNLELCVHELVEVTLICEGNGVYKALNRVVPCKENDIFVTHANVPYNFYRTEDSARLKLQRLYFAPDDWFDRGVSDPAHRRYCYGVFQGNMSTAYAMLDEQTRKVIMSLWNMIINELKEKSTEWQDSVRSNLILLMITVARYINRAIKKILIHRKRSGDLSLV